MRYYGRKSEIIYPPIEFSRFKINKAKDFYLFVGQLNPYKKADLAVRAFNQSGKKLLVIGDGPQRKKLEKLAGPNISILGNQTDDVLNGYYSTCNGLVFPGEEDFGITPLEAMASGKPVIAYSKGGALETVIDGKTGILFHDQNEHALNYAIEKAKDICWDVDFLREQAKKFDKAIIKKKLQNLIMQKYEGFQISVGAEITRNMALDH
jgi:glycosyltransferase involved in cell wall biosynthesis